MNNNAIQNIYPNNFIGLIVGDSMASISAPWNFGVPPYRTWGPQLTDFLINDGLDVLFRTQGVAGATTAQIMATMKKNLFWGIPDIAVVYCGVNDPFATVSNVSVSAATANTITLNTAGTGTLGLLQNSYLGQTISITSGTGSGQTNTIIGYTTSKVATVANNWTTTPDTTSVISIAAPTQAQTQANLQALIKSLKYNANGIKEDSQVHVWSQTQLPANGEPGNRYVVMNDTSVNGGVTGFISSMNPNITTNTSSAPIQSVWEYRNQRAGELGWGRVAVAGTTAFSSGCQLISVMSTNYLNWSTGGDNAGAGTYYAPYVPIRAAQLAAQTAEGVDYINQFLYDTCLIQGGTYEGQTIAAQYTQGDHLWHIIDGDQHHNRYGNDNVTNAVYLHWNNSNGGTSTIKKLQNLRKDI